MTAIWLLSTRGRPKEAQATIDACMETGMTSPGVVYCDETAYPKLKLPANWRMHHEPEWRSLQGSMSWCFDNYPDATQYGWLADDTRPRTKRWDKKLEKAAGDWNLAYAADLWMSEDAGMLEQLEVGRDLSSGLCWGGELIRTVGWWALPNVRQAGIDTAWTELVRPLKLFRYVDDVTVEHLNWRTGKRRYDAVDNWERDGVNVIHEDLVERDRWASSVEFRDTLRRLGVAIGEPNHVQAAKMHALRESYANDKFMETGSMVGARLTKMLEGGFDDEIERADADKRQARMDRPGGQVGAEPDLRRLGADRL